MPSSPIESNHTDDDKVMYHSVKQGKKEDHVIDATDTLGTTVIGIESRAKQYRPKSSIQ